MPEGGGGPYAALVSAVADTLNISSAAASQLVTAWLNEPGHEGISTNAQAQQAFNEIVAAASTGTSGNGNGGGDDGVSVVPVVNPGVGPGGSSSSGAVGPDPAELRASYESVLRSWGIPVTPRMNQLIEQALAGQWGTARFISVLRGTKEYKLQFAGIQWREGMNEAQYNAQYNQYQDMAQDIGYHLSREGFGTLMRKGKDVREWGLAIRAVKSIRANRDQLEALREVLVERDLRKPNEKFKPKELLDFVIGRGSPEWTAIWNEAAAAAALETYAGIDVGTDIGRKQLLRILKQAQVPLGPGELVPVDYGLLLQAKKLLPLSKWYSMGISGGDWAELAYGGARAPQVAERVKQLMATHEAFYESRANPQLVQSQTGTQLLTGGLGSQVATE